MESVRNVLGQSAQHFDQLRVIDEHTLPVRMQAWNNNIETIIKGAEWSEPEPGDSQKLRVEQHSCLFWSQIKGFN